MHLAIGASISSWHIHMHGIASEDCVGTMFETPLVYTQMVASYELLLSRSLWMQCQNEKTGNQKLNLKLAFQSYSILKFQLTRTNPISAETILC